MGLTVTFRHFEPNDALKNLFRREGFKKLKGMCLILENHM